MIPSLLSFPVRITTNRKIDRYNQKKWGSAREQRLVSTKSISAVSVTIAEQEMLGSEKVDAVGGRASKGEAAASKILRACPVNFWWSSKHHKLPTSQSLIKSDSRTLTFFDRHSFTFLCLPCPSVFYPVIFHFFLVYPSHRTSASHIRKSP